MSFTEDNLWSRNSPWCTRYFWWRTDPHPWKYGRFNLVKTNILRPTLPCITLLLNSSVNGDELAHIITEVLHRKLNGRPLLNSNEGQNASNTKALQNGVHIVPRNVWHWVHLPLSRLGGFEKKLEHKENQTKYRKNDQKASMSCENFNILNMDYFHS